MKIGTYGTETEMRKSICPMMSTGCISHLCGPVEVAKIKCITTECTLLRELFNMSQEKLGYYCGLGGIPK